MSKKEERKYKKVKTAELLDFVAEDIPYKKDKERDKQMDYKDELEQREPFSDIKRKIDQQDSEISDLNKAIKILIDHKHDNDGTVMTPAKDKIPMRFY